MTVRVGINGFGRIGRQSLKALLERAPDVEVVAVNDLVDVPTNALLFKHDSTYGAFDGDVSHRYDPAAHTIISNASCTTNCLAPAAKVVHDTFGIRRGLMNTIHSYTNDQKILDVAHKDPRRARAAGLNIIPTSTGAAKALALVIPDLKGKFDGFSLRVPTPTVSIVDFTAELERETTVDGLNQAFIDAANGPLQGILGVSDEPLVSMDFKGDTRSSIIDLESTMVLGGNFVKVIAWYDNEWGYSCRVADLTKFVAERLA
jgi:glyceraldehyde 3-phosphate dehydrogenase